MKATSLGEKLRAYRLERQLSQEEAAWQIGISRTQIGRLERDESRPSLETMDRIEEAFGLPKGSLISDYTTTNDEKGVLRGIETRLLNASLSLDELKKIALILEKDPIGGQNNRLCIWVIGHTLVVLPDFNCYRTGCMEDMEETESRSLGRICISGPR